MNIEQLVSAIVQHSLRQHEDSAWDIVATGMRRDEIATVLRSAGAHTVNQAKRAMRAHLDSILVPA
jgi:hypothetical protein